MKVLFSNVLGFVLGGIVLIIATYVISMVMGSVIAIPLLGSILSYPSSPILYASTAVNIGATALSLIACDKVCMRSTKGKKMGYIIFDGLVIVGGVFAVVSTFASAGFSDNIIGLISCPVTGLIMMKKGFREE